MSSPGPHKREAGGSESEMEEAALLAVTMEEGPRARDAVPLEAGTGRKRFSRGLQKDEPCPHLGLAPRGPCGTPDPRTVGESMCVVLIYKMCGTCYSSCRQSIWLVWETTSQVKFCVLLASLSSRPSHTLTVPPTHGQCWPTMSGGDSYRLLLPQPTAGPPWGALPCCLGPDLPVKLCQLHFSRGAPDHQLRAGPSRMH